LELHIINNIGEKLKAYWLSQDLSFNPEVPKEALIHFETKYHIQIPDDMRKYFLQVNGMNSQYMDNAGFTFWELKWVQLLTEEYREEEYRILEDAEAYFVFADCIACSWVYAIKMEKSCKNENFIIIFGLTGKPLKIANNFSEFVQLYLNNSPILYGENVIES
jgi:hypothetical protein